MAYQVLARKWRPRNFATLVGQEHVVRALTHALQHKRLHHAYLFTGTRGVGKTTLARILAKSLNCMGTDGQGDITAEPCGVCRACTEIDSGRFVDLIEVDAATNTRVDEMRQLLENAVYAPTAGRYKVYVIDEVHMLSNSAFNAMLKTLEEPPEHIKFILATTDPQKIPVTVLSRCLQFNLKQMLPSAIVEHLQRILGEEHIPFELPALHLIAQAAHGSMRDALSLMDQAIAYSAGEVSEASVRTMLGAIDQDYLQRILQALQQQDGVALLAVVDDMAARSLSYPRALQDLAVLLHRLAILQTVPAALDSTHPETMLLQPFVQAFTPEQVQLYYQIALHGRNDMNLAPDEYTGFSMTLLRMLAFIPMQANQLTQAHPLPQTKAVLPPTPAATNNAPRAAGLVASQIARTSATLPSKPVQPQAQELSRVSEATKNNSSALASNANAALTHDATIEFSGDWLQLANQVGATGLAKQFLQQSELLAHHGIQFQVRVPIKTLADSSTVEKVRMLLSQYFGAAVRLQVEVGAVAGPTVAHVEAGMKAEQQQQAEQTIANDPFVNELLTQMGGTIIPNSIKPA